MNNFLLTTDGRSIEAVEKQVRKYLPGLDVRLWPASARQAVIRAPLVHALETEYPNIGAGPLLKVLGVDQIQPISDEATASLLTARDRPVVPPPTAVTVASPVAGLDWHLPFVRAPQAWDLLGGRDAIVWGDVRVGQIDTGYTTHPVFGFPAASWVDQAQAATFVPTPPEGEASMFPTEPGSGLDNLQGTNGGHGTRIGATICGHAPTAAGGAYFGVAPRVPLVPVRITDVVWINNAQREFALAVQHLVGVARVSVINVSLGVFGAVVIDEMKDAINLAYEAGVIMVCAAGNIVNPVVAPAKLARTIAVGGVTHAAVPWAGSSYGPQTDFSAPAADLRRADTQAGGQFVFGQGGDGTSYATAITSGAAALWLVHRREQIAADYPLAWQRVAAFTQLARASARVPDVWQPGAFGTGILDVEALLNAPLPSAASLQLAQPA